MRTLRDAAQRIPDDWDPMWFRRYVSEVLAQADVRRATGEGVSVSIESGGAALSVAPHNADAAAHPALIVNHKAETDPHPQYLTATEGDALFLTPAEGDGRYGALADVTALLGKLKWGAGSPEGAVTAAVGTLYLRTDGSAGTTLYVKESGTGNSGWTGK